MGLFNKKKKAIIQSQQRLQNNIHKNSLGDNLDKLINGELPFGWYAYNKNFVKSKDEQMTAFALKTQAKDESEKIAALQTLIQYFYSYQAECKSMGECFEKYFDDMWMHCKNSRCDDFIYITPYEEELKELMQSR